MPKTPSPTLETHLRSHKQAEQHALKRQARHRLLPSDPRGGGGSPVPFLHLSLLALKNTTHSLIPLPLTHTVFFSPRLLLSPSPYLSPPLHLLISPSLSLFISL